MLPLEQGNAIGQAARAHLTGRYGYAMSLSQNQAEAEGLVQLTPESNLKS
jgi:hypothetical protein